MTEPTLGSLRVHGAILQYETCTTKCAATARPCY